MLQILCAVYLSMLKSADPADGALADPEVGFRGLKLPFEKYYGFDGEPTGTGTDLKVEHPALDRTYEPPPYFKLDALLLEDWGMYSKTHLMQNKSAVAAAARLLLLKCLPVHWMYEILGC